MQPKRATTSVDLAALAGELATYDGAKVDKAYLYPESLVRLKMRDFDRGRVELLIDLGETKHVRVADPDHVPAAPERPPNFAMMLRNRIEGADLVGVEQFEFDRILQFHFERGETSTTLVVELFGDGNLAVLDEVGEVIDSLETVRLKSRTVVPGATYEFPEARFDPLAVDFETFAARFEQSDTDVVRTLATQFNFGGTWGEELCTRAGVEKTLDVEEADESTVEALYRTVSALGERLRGGDLDPCLYREDDQRVDVTPVPMEEYADLGVERFDSFTAALDDYYTYFDAEDDEPSQATPDRPDFEEEIEKKERIVAQQEDAIEEFEAAAETERQKAKSLYAHYDLVDEVLSTVREAREADHAWDEIEERFDEGAERGIPAAEAVRAVDGSEGTVTVDIEGRPVTLRVSDGVEKNVDRLYREAKRIEEKKAGAEEAIARTREELAELEAKREAWEADEGEGDGAGAGDETAGDSAAGEGGVEAGEGGNGAVQGGNEGGEGGEEGSAAADTDTDWLARSSIPVRSTEEWYERFRWFHTSDGFLVIGGRNADQNEEIVEKYLSRGDRFFHAQAHGGPATVLKATGPSEAYDEDITIPDSSEHEAAQFAVSYSSVWKDGRYSGDAYAVDHDQVSKTPEHGEYLEKGGFAVRGDRTAFDDVAVAVAVGIACEPESRVLGGPPSAIDPAVETAIEVEPGKYAQNDIAKRLYREFKARFADETFVRKVASPDLIQEFLPPGTSSMVE